MRMGGGDGKKSGIFLPTAESSKQAIVLESRLLSWHSSSPERFFATRLNQKASTSSIYAFTRNVWGGAGHQPTARVRKAVRKQAGTQPLQGLNPQNMPRISICMIMNAANGMLLLTHLESSTRASGRGSAPSLMASNHTRGSRLGTATKGFMSLLETCFCWVSSKLPTAPWLSSVATPVADNRRTAASPSPFLLAPRRATAAVCCCVNRASPVLRRTAAAAEPAAPLPTLDTGAERKESVGPRDSNPAATASTMDSLLDSDPPRPLCCCSCRPMVVVSVLSY